MTRFRLNKSFEEELANKANEFRMEPNASTWSSIEASIPAKKINFSWKTGAGIGLVSIIAILSFFIPTDKNKETQTTANSISEVNAAPLELSEQFNSPIQIQSKPIAETKKPNIIDVSNHLNLQGEETQSWEVQASTIQNIKSQIASVESRPEVDNQLATIQASAPTKQRRLTKFQDGLNLVVNISPQYSYRTLEARNDIGRPIVNQRQQHDQALNSLNIGIAARYYFSDKFSMSIGLNYNSWGENIGLRPGFKNVFYDSLAEANGYHSEEMFQPGKEFRHQNKYTHLEIPVIFSKDKALGPRLSVSMSAGIALTYTKSEKCVMYDYSLHHYVNNKNLLRNWNASLLTAVKLQYKIQDRWTFMTGPELRYGFLSTYNDSYPMSQHQYSIGWNFGLQWKLFGQPKGIWSK